MPPVLVGLAVAVLALGGFICLANFRLFLAWLSHCLRPAPQPSHPHVSAIPIVGSLLVFLMLRPLADFPAAQIVGWLLIAVDMGGLHWMILGLPYALYRNRQRARAARTGRGRGKSLGGCGLFPQPEGSAAPVGNNAWKLGAAYGRPMPGPVQLD